MFINDEPDLTNEEKSEAANIEAQQALQACKRIKRPIDLIKCQAANNALIGNPFEIAEQIVDRFLLKNYNGMV